VAEQIRTAIQTWQNSNLDEGALLRGKPLVDAEYWQQQRRDELSESEISFIEVSLKFAIAIFLSINKGGKLTISGYQHRFGISLDFGWE
jgi:hypothetical protein